MADAGSTFARVHTWDGVPFGGLPLPPTVLGRISAHARSRGDAPFLTAVSSLYETEKLSYRELDVLSRRIASWTRRELCSGPGGVLALRPSNDVRSVVTILGLLRAGSALLLLNPADPPARQQQQAGAVDAPILGFGQAASEGDPAAIHVPDATTLDDHAVGGGPELTNPVAAALLFGTSGSTAASKLVAQSHLNAVVNAHAVCRHHGLGPDDRVLGCLPIHHVNGLHFTLLATLVAGAHAILAHAFDPFIYPRLIEHFRPRIASVVPSILEALVDTWRGPPISRELGYFVSAAAPVSASTVRAVGDRVGVRVLQGYGLTETTNFSTTMPVDLSEGTYRRIACEADIPSIGAALYGNEVAVLSASDERVALGEEGEICIRGHNVMSGYAGNASATEEAFRGGWFHSGDIGIAVEDPESVRTFFVITGRRKNIAKVRGESVSLDELDRVLRAVPGVLDAACVAVAHRSHGEEIIAAVKVSEADWPIDLHAWLKTALPPTALPRRIVRLAVIPRTATGKIRRGELAQIVAPDYTESDQNDL